MILAHSEISKHFREGSHIQFFFMSSMHDETPTRQPYNCLSPYQHSSIFVAYSLICCQHLPEIHSSDLSQCRFQIRPRYRETCPIVLPMMRERHKQVTCSLLPQSHLHKLLVHSLVRLTALISTNSNCNSFSPHCLIPFLNTRVRNPRYQTSSCTFISSTVHHSRKRISEAIP